MVEPLSVDTDGVRTLGDIHTAVSAGLGSLAAAAPGTGPVAASHGAIAFGVETALTAALGSRTGSINATQASAAQISELLHQAALAYERGDQRGAEAIRTAADRIDQGQGSAIGGAGSAPAGSAGGADVIGQAVGQLGQLGQQLPPQITQGVQQMAQSASRSTEYSGDAESGADRDERPPTGAVPGEQPGSGRAPVAPDDPQESAPTRAAGD